MSRRKAAKPPALNSRQDSHNAPPAQAARASRRSWIIAVAVIVAGAGGVRVWAAQDEFWLDEIWTLLAFGRNIHSPFDIFTAHHDNNHYLVVNKPFRASGSSTSGSLFEPSIRWGREVMIKRI